MTWPRWGTAWDGLVMEHPTPERFTVEIGFSSLPTPRSEKMTGENAETWSARTQDGKHASKPLALAVQMLPTPTSSEHKYRLQGDSQQSNCLEARARRGELLPTPQAWDAKDYHAAKPEIVKTREQQKKRGGGCANLAERMAAQMLPTPAASQMGKPVRPLIPSEIDGTPGTMLVGAIGQAIGENGESVQRLGLNPEFVEVMMNFPVGWTELTD